LSRSVHRPPDPTSSESVADVSVWLGNDVVDLRHPRCRARPEDDRLPLRILTEAERGWREAAPEEEGRLRRLWALWAAKETAFKAVSKAAGQPPVFRHKEFVASIREWLDDDVFHFSGIVHWRGHRCHIEGMATAEFLHMVGWIGIVPDRDHARGAESSPPLLEVGIEGSGTEPAEEEGSGLSGRVRRLACRRLASHLRRLGMGDDAGVNGHAPSIHIGSSGNGGRRRPPGVWVNDRPLHGVDLSISHHGRYVAWVFGLPTGGNSALLCLKDEDGPDAGKGSGSGPITDDS